MPTISCAKMIMLTKYINKTSVTRQLHTNNHCENFLNLSNSLIKIPKNAQEIIKIHANNMDIINKFMQNITTQNILNNQNSLFTGFLNTKGRLISTAIIYRSHTYNNDNNQFTAILPQNTAQILIQHIKTLDFRGKIKIENFTENLHNYAYLHSEKNSKISEIKENLQENAIVFQDPRSEKLGTRILIPKCENGEIMEKLSEKLEIPVMPFQFYNSLRLIYGIPSFLTHELSSGNSLPLESNLDFYNGISFKKGCYLGQETTARANFVGTTRKRLYNVVISGKHTEIKVLHSNQTNLRTLDEFEIDEYKGKSLLPYNFIDTKYALNELTKGLKANTDSGDAVALEIYQRPAAGSNQEMKRIGQLVVPVDPLFSSCFNVGMALLRDEHVEKQHEQPLIILIPDGSGQQQEFALTAYLPTIEHARKHKN